MTAEQFAEALRLLLNAEVPDCAAYYRPDFIDAWKRDPSRAFLRLTELDQRNVWETLQRGARA